MLDVPDEELLERRPVDPAAFGLFYERHCVAVFRYAGWRVASVEDAADLTAEVFAVALESAGRFRASSAPARAWLFGIANHKLLDLRRRGAVDDRARRRLGMQRPEFDDLEELGQSVDALVADLLTGERAAVVAKVVDEKSYREIATGLGESEKAVRQRVHRGLRRLEAALREESS